MRKWRNHGYMSNTYYTYFLKESSIKFWLASCVLHCLKMTYLCVKIRYNVDIVVPSRLRICISVCIDRCYYVLGCVLSGEAILTSTSRVGDIYADADEQHTRDRNGL